MELSRRQRDILNGMVLGDAYLKKSSGNNACLRLEHSYKQVAYMNWKYSELEHIFLSEPKMLKRTHPLSKRTYQYVRLQSYTSPLLGEIRLQFYGQNGKQLPVDLESMLASSLTIAVWYMDDGYYYQRDRSSHIYLQKFESSEIERLIEEE